MFADLHIHSVYSDGTLSPDDVIEKAKNQKVTLISICDHNSIDAYVESESLFRNNEVTVIPGVEITSVMDNIEYHILAYGFDIKNKTLNDLLQYNRDVYIGMGNNLIENISVDYPSVSLKEFLGYKRSLKNGGWDSIDYLRNKGLVADWEGYSDILRKYGSRPKQGFLSPTEVIKIIHNAGGYAVLAHLYHYEKSDNAGYEKKAIQFINMGIDGFECYYPFHSSELTGLLVKLCHEHDLLVTAGSDDHGGFIGVPGGEYFIGAVKIEVERLNLKGLKRASRSK